MNKINRENAKEVDMRYIGNTIEEMVEYLINCREKGKSVYVKFNGKILYSADVTLEDAYMQITGFTKEEINNGNAELLAAKTEEEKNVIEEKYAKIKQRHIYESNIKTNQKEKEKLTSEINDIEQQLVVLKAKEVEQKESIDSNQHQFEEEEK